MLLSYRPRVRYQIRDIGLWLPDSHRLWSWRGLQSRRHRRPKGHASSEYPHGDHNRVLLADYRRNSLHCCIAESALSSDAETISNAIRQGNKLEEPTRCFSAANAGGFTAR